MGARSAEIFNISTKFFYKNWLTQNAFCLRKAVIFIHIAPHLHFHYFLQKFLTNERAQRGNFLK